MMDQTAKKTHEPRRGLGHTWCRMLVMPSSGRRKRSDLNDFLQEEGKFRDQWTMKLMSLIHPSSSSSPLECCLGALIKKECQAREGFQAGTQQLWVERWAQGCVKPHLGHLRPRGRSSRNLSLTVAAHFKFLPLEAS